MCRTGESQVLIYFKPTELLNEIIPWTHKHLVVLFIFAVLGLVLLYSKKSHVIVFCLISIQDMVTMARNRQNVMVYIKLADLKAFIVNDKGGFLGK